MIATTSIRQTVLTILSVVSLVQLHAAQPSWVISGNETKIDLTSGALLP